jgi:hypothetical protein
VNPLAADLATLGSTLVPQCPLEPSAKTVRELKFPATFATQSAVKTCLNNGMLREATVELCAACTNQLVGH